MKINKSILILSIIILLECSHRIKISQSHDPESILRGHWSHNSGEARNYYGSSVELYLNDYNTFSLNLSSSIYKNEGYFKTNKDTIFFENSENITYKNLKFIYKFDFENHKMILQPIPNEINQTPDLYIGTWFKKNRWNKVMKLDGVY